MPRQGRELRHLLTPEEWTTAITTTRAFIHRVSGYEITDDALVRNIVDHQSKGYKYSESRRLALLGDYALKGAVLENWYPTGRHTGAASTLMARMTSNKTLAARGWQMGIESLVVQGPGVEEDASEERVATVVEAVLGAIWLHSGRDRAVVEAAVKKMELHRPLSSS